MIMHQLNHCILFQFHFVHILYELNNSINGKGKEYYWNGKLLFEGEYLNGEKNGKGKEYKYGYLIFEGEYINGKRNGKGKEYHGHYVIECLYLNGQRIK